MKFSAHSIQSCHYGIRINRRSAFTSFYLSKNPLYSGLFSNLIISFIQLLNLFHWKFLNYFLGQGFDFNLFLCIMKQKYFKDFFAYWNSYFYMNRSLTKILDIKILFRVSNDFLSSKSISVGFAGSSISYGINIMS